jgi:UDP-N-acetylmuramoylalanine--D-glutamate ligase
MSEFEGMKILVVGLGSSGEAAARVLTGLGALPVVVDSSGTPSHAGDAEALRSLGVEVRLGVSVPDDMDGFDLVVASPGVPDRAPVLTEARKGGLRVISELELGYRLLEHNTFVAVTGTNGKTTTTRMIAEMLDRPGRRAVPCGNIGTPLVGLHGQVGPDDVLVCEVSSFQLQNIEKFHARASAVLNLAPDHFDWHRDMEEYGRAKERIIENMNKDEFLIYNIEDAFCRSLAARAAGRTAGFGLARVEGSAVWLHEGRVFTGPPLPEVDLLDTEELKVAGPHNVENVMAAAAVSLALGEDPSRISRAALSFEGLEHRVEPVGEVNGVAFYNDSKATNPHASLHAIRSFEGRFSLIMGGRNKGLDFSELAGEVCSLMAGGRLAGVVLLGESAPEIRLAIEKVCAPAAAMVTAGDLDESVSAAYGMVGRGEAVLFSPACASFDMFEDYKDRGRQFKAAVGMLAGGDDSGSIS